MNQRYWFGKSVLGSKLPEKNKSFHPNGLLGCDAESNQWPWTCFEQLKHGESKIQFPGKASEPSDRNQKG